MGVDVVHILRLGAGVCNGHGHGLGAAAAVGPRGSHVIGVAGGAVAYEFRIDLGAPGLGVLQLLQQQDRRAFAQDEAAALASKGMEARLGSGFWLRAFMDVKAPMARGGDTGFRAAAEHDVSITVPDIVEGISYGIGAAGRRSPGRSTCPGSRCEWRSDRRPCCR